ncbi:hypothetical protein ABC255_07290 [Neobacillus sp. 3P2-tot-E-2]|uniref:PilN domain-containing protein n=1 Tax=Neobacillus sp. 3P2-tot-E-2 TaxID=3132212 RepID=UPI0039A03A89
MLVEINLLPQKEPRNTGFIFSLSVMLVLFLLIGGFYFWQVQSAKTDLANLESQIEMTKKIAEAEHKNAEANVSSMSVTVLQNAVEWANIYPIKTVPVMQHLTSLLPERGFIQSFSYTEAGTVSLTVQFDNTREAAYFLEHLNDSLWVKEASLNSLNISEKEETTETATETNQTTTQTATTSEESQPVVVTIDPNNPNSFTYTPVNPTFTTEGNDKSKEPNNYLPRYIGQYDIKFNKETIKELITKDRSAEEGVTGS